MLIGKKQLKTIRKSINLFILVVLFTGLCQIEAIFDFCKRIFTDFWLFDEAYMGFMSI